MPFFCLGGSRFVHWVCEGPTKGQLTGTTPTILPLREVGVNHTAGPDGRMKRNARGPHDPRPPFRLWVVLIRVLPKAVRRHAIIAIKRQAKAPALWVLPSFVLKVPLQNRRPRSPQSGVFSGRVQPIQSGLGLGVGSVLREGPTSVGTLGDGARRYLRDGTHAVAPHRFLDRTMRPAACAVLRYLAAGHGTALVADCLPEVPIGSGVCLSQL